MEQMDKKFSEDLMEANRSWQSAEHIINVVMPVVKDEKLLLRSLEILYKGSVKIISTILKYEFIFKRVELKAEAARNLDIFFRKCTARYELSEEDCHKLRDLIKLGKKHKESGFEFSRTGKMIIMGDDLSTYEVNKHTIDAFIHVLRKLTTNARTVITKENSI
ncbi:MAG: hypothetical protein WCK29_03575 [archaeon]